MKIQKHCEGYFDGWLQACIDFPSADYNALPINAIPCPQYASEYAEGYKEAWLEATLEEQAYHGSYGYCLRRIENNNTFQLGTISGRDKAMQDLCGGFYDDEPTIGSTDSVFAAGFRLGYQRGWDSLGGDEDMYTMQTGSSII